MKTYVRNYLCLLLLSLLIVFSATSAWAMTAANTQITNAATLTYSDGTSTQKSIASVTVTVTLVPAAPSIVKGADQSGNYAGSSTTLTDTYTITATSNGPDTYNIAAIIGTTTNTSGPTATPSGNIYIGATVTVAGSTDASHINVPYDGTPDGIVNGIAVNDWVVIGGALRQVTAISENAATGITTITLNSALGSIPSAGVLVAGQKTVTVAVTAGTIVASGSTIQVPEHITATSNSGAGPAATSGDVNNSYYSGLATIAKYVRNVTTPSTGTTSIQYPSGTGPTYYQTGVKAAPGEILEYLLISTNSGLGPCYTSVVTDGLPTAYVVFQTGIYSGNDVTYYNEAGTASTLKADGTTTANYVSPTLTVNVGTGATSSAGGTIAASKSVAVLYQAKVNP